MTKQQRKEVWIEKNKQWSKFIQELRQDVRQMYKRKVCIDSLKSY